MTWLIGISVRTTAIVIALAAATGASAATASKEASSAAKETGSSEPAAIFPGTSSKEPISIDADKLVYFDKERKAIYTGSVVVIQGETKMTCSAMTILLDRAPTAGATPAAAAAPAPSPAGQGGSPSNSGVKHMDAVGPVTVISKTQVATGDSGSYDKAQDKVWLIGHVTLSDGQNVTKGDRLTYDLKSGQATIDTSAKGRVHGQFIPNSESSAATPAPGAAAAKAK